MAIQKLDLSGPLRSWKPSEMSPSLTMAQMQQQTLGEELTVEKMRSEIARMKREATSAVSEEQKAAKVQAIVSQGLPLEETYKQLSTVDITFAEKWAQLQTQNQAAQRAEGIQNAGLLEGKPGVSPKVPMAPTQEAAIPQSLDGTMGATPAPVTPPGTRTIDAVQAPHPTFEIPSRFGPSMRIQPRTQGQNDVRTEEAAQATAERTRETERAQQQAESDFAPPPAPRNIDPNSPEGIAARLEFDNKRYKPPVTAPAPRNIDPLSPEGIAARLSVPTADARNRATSLSKIDPVLASINELSEKINTGAGLTAKAVGEIEKAKAKANYNDDVAEYQALISGFTPMVARAVGHTGVLTQQDVDSVRELFPKPGDSKTLRDRKVARVKSILSAGESASEAAGGAKAPADVDQAIWDVMTPEERALWQN